MRPASLHLKFNTAGYTFHFRYYTFSFKMGQKTENWQDGLPTWPIMFLRCFNATVVSLTVIATAWCVLTLTAQAHAIAVRLRAAVV